MICDNALLNGFALGRQPVGREIVTEVVRDFDLTIRAAEADAPAVPEEDDRQARRTTSHDVAPTPVPAEDGGRGRATREQPAGGDVSRGCDPTTVLVRSVRERR